LENCAISYLALFKEMKANNHLDSYQLIMLAHRVKSAMIDRRYEKLDDRFKQRLVTLKDSLPSSVRELIWCEQCRIKNAQNGEYLFATGYTLFYQNQHKVLTSGL